MSSRAAQTGVFFFFYLSGYMAGVGQNWISALRLEPVYFEHNIRPKRSDKPAVLIQKPEPRTGL
jgi:hypothetical protein